MKLKSPLVSILINNYNNEKYCVKAIQSALKQNYNRIEIIFYDDYSSDNSLDKVKRIKSFEPTFVRLRGMFTRKS